MIRFDLVRAIIVGVLLCSCARTDSGDYSKYPVLLNSSRDIANASINTDNISIGRLPIDDYPALVKFTKLKRVQFTTKEGTGANDDKLFALSQVGLTNLFDVNLLNCPQVTDRGIEHLARLPALRYLQLEGTSIADAGCNILAMKRSVTGVNVANCRNVTLKGLIDLAHSQTLDEFGFTFEQMTQDDVVKLISEFWHITWCQINDPKGEIDATVVKKAAEAKGVKVVFQAIGALQTFRGEEWRPWTSKTKGGT